MITEELEQLQINRGKVTFVGIFYLDNIFQDHNDGYDLLLDILFNIASNGELLFLEYGYTWLNEFTSENVFTIVDKRNQRIWYQPLDKEQAKEILHHDFMVNAIILRTETDIDSWVYKLRVVEDINSIQLKVIESNDGDFLKLLQTSLKPFLEQGVCIVD